MMRATLSPGDGVTPTREIDSFLILEKATPDGKADS